MIWLCALLAGSSAAMITWARLTPATGIPIKAETYKHLKNKWETYLAPTNSHLKIWQFAALTILPTLATAWIIWLVTDLWILALLCALATATLPSLWLHQYTTKKAKERRQAWPSFIENLLSGIRSGMSLGEILLDIENKAPKPLQEPLTAFAQTYRNNSNLDEALIQLKNQLADATADRIIESLRLAAKVGGIRLAPIFEELSQMMRHEERIRSEIEARQSWTKIAARLACCAPWLVLALLTTNQQTAQIYSTKLGSTILISGALISLVAYLLMQKLAKLPQAPRPLK